MWLSRLSTFWRGAWRTLPVETLVVAAAAIGAMGVVHDRGGVWFLRLCLAGVVLTPLAFAGHGLGRLGRRGQLVAGALAAVGVLGALAVWFPEQETLRSPAFYWPYRLAVLAAMLVPFVAFGGQFTRFVRRFFEQTTTWGLLWLGAIAALAVVIVALQELFGLRIERLGADAVIVLTAGFILVYLHRLLDDDPAAPGRMPELWRRLATTIGAPFVSVMLAILVVYEIVALVRGELPRNMLSPLIMAAGFVGFLSTLIISSVLGEDAGAAVLQPAERHRWARRRSIRLARAFPIVLLALLPMAGWALWIRVEQYGFTPFRAVRVMGLMCLAILSLVGAIRWLRGRAPLGWEVPGAILLFTLAAAFGPTSAVRLSIASQARLAGRWLDEVGAGRTIDATSEARRIEIDPSRHRELRDAIVLLAKLGGEPALRGVLSGSLELCSNWWRSSDCLKQLGVYERGDVEPVSDSVTSYATLVASGRFATGPGQLALVELSRRAGAPAPRPGDGELSQAEPEHLVLLADSVVVYTGDQETARASLTGLLAAWSGDRILPARMLPLVQPDGAPVAELAVQAIDGRRDGAAAVEALHLTGAIVWR